MSNLFQFKNLLFVCCLLLFLAANKLGFGQTTIYSENFGTGTTFPTGWSSPGSDPWTNSTDAPVSFGYSGASGGGFALSPIKNNREGTLYSKSISTEGYTNITVLWAARRPTWTDISPTLEWSSDGTSWNLIGFTDISSTGTWGFVNSGVRISLPSSVNGVSSLQFRWYIYDSRSNYRIDDFSVQGCLLPAQPSAITGSISPCQGSSQSYSVTNVAGVSYAWSFPSGWTQNAGGTSNSVTVTVGAGSGNITVTPSNACGNGTARTMGITVSPTNTSSPASSTPTLCINSLLSPNITHSTTGATGIGAATGLPAGVSAVWSSNTITISGTPTVSGTFNYSILLTGGCGTVSATGTITVNPLPSPTLAPTGTEACATDNVVYTTDSGQTNYTWTMPGSVLNTDYTVIAGGGTNDNSITLKWITAGSKSVSVNYTNTNGCTAVTAATSTITVHPIPVIGSFN